MGFQEKFKQSVSKGLEHSKSFFSSAKDKAKELGDVGILRFEIHQLEEKIKKQELQLGHQVYEILAVEGKQSLTKRSAGIKEIIEAIEDLQTQVTGKRVVLEDVESRDDTGEQKEAEGSESEEKPGIE
ncbi:hypothetical protein [Marispirochaeta aestuarii]|uniref:hypothetical protein n=1 Tax=Marispirochaeta aestuarii TaxID=1963862 RepID=UPI002ABD47F9|nr:hypothetical protein [Marispirochaeta aestuarii]